ncbi:hypothetical protein ACGFZP_35265 [Kitasatospora sp. NPDC048239]|uniref:hypothetical protein n=1 Tax=Kitasatospora sp. NPDC048239 TaxID=3364046 RepID=UPI0037134C6F
MARRDGDVEAFTAFLGGLLAVALLALALAGIGALIDPAPWQRGAALVLLAAVWPGTTVWIYLRLTGKASR